MAEAEDLKSSQCGFDPHSGHSKYQLSRAILARKDENAYPRWSLFPFESKVGELLAFPRNSCTVVAMEIDTFTPTTSFVVHLDSRRRPALPLGLLAAAGIPASTTGLLAYTDRRGRIILEDPISALDALNILVMEDMGDHGFAGTLEDDLYAERASDTSVNQ